MNIKQITELIKSITNFKNNIIFECHLDNKDSIMVIPNTFKFNSLFPEFLFTDIPSSLVPMIDHYFQL
jgi:hypothetical protein